MHDDLVHKAAAWLNYNDISDLKGRYYVGNG